METTPQPTVYSGPRSPMIFGTKIPSTVAFLVGALLFLLPFAEIKCSGTTLASKSGLDIALQKEWKTSGKDMLGKKEVTDVSTKPTKQEKGNSWIFAMAALGLGVLGLLLSFADAKTGGSGGLATGILAAGGLIGLMVQLKKEFNDSVAKSAMDTGEKGADTLGFGKLGDQLNSVKPTLNFTPWFYVAVIAFLAAAFFCYKRMHIAKKYRGS